MAGDKPLVLVTGISGFIGKHVALAAAKAGYRVRGTVRKAAKGEQTRATLLANGVVGEDLEIVEADLLSDAGWDHAVADCHGVFHVASPFPLATPKDPDRLIRPAREGTVRVMQAALNAGVRRFVVTSSVAAVMDAREPDARRPFTEEDWSREAGTAPYALSKTLAERAAWAFAAEHPDMEVTAVLPSFVQGPPLDDDMESSAEVVTMLLKGTYPMVPKVEFGFVDVRDLARFHVEAMQCAQAAGERLIASNGSRSMLRMAEILRSAIPRNAGKLPKREMPNLMVRLVALFDTGAKAILPMLDKPQRYDTSKAAGVLGFEHMYSPEEAIAAMAGKVVEAGRI